MSRRREFTRTVKLAAWDRCEGEDGVHRCECEDCGGIDNTQGLPILPSDPPEYDHLIEAEFDGDNSLANCRCVRRSHHRKKTSERAKVIAKSRSVRARHANAKPKGRGFRGWRTFSGEIRWKDRQ